MPESNVVITPDALLDHWQGHRRLTRRLIEAFPEKELFAYSIGGMRTFSQLATEFVRVGAAVALVDHCLRRRLHFVQLNVRHVRPVLVVVPLLHIVIFFCLK